MTTATATTVTIINHILQVFPKSWLLPNYH